MMEVAGLVAVGAVPTESANLHLVPTLAVTGPVNQWQVRALKVVRLTVP
ncbi:MAG: hypothetical protein BWX66_01758 [Deltaproteobacteria bacterium ADurb.Bin058]|nr:MAG: hypothetical protein BWX66_01758 [Deltaproteobacteria bacterium ADurb.Bin058]